MKGLSVKWQKLIVWLTGYVNIVAFILAGGYLYKNTEHEEVKHSAKIALVLTAVFTALEALCTFLLDCVYLAESSYTWISKTSLVIELIKVIAFAAMIIIDLTIGLESDKKDNTTKAYEENDNTEQDN